jgi:hypothetical protein
VRCGTSFDKYHAHHLAHRGCTSPVDVGATNECRHAPLWKTYE